MARFRGVSARRADESGNARDLNAAMSGPFFGVGRTRASVLLAVLLLAYTLTLLRDGGALLLLSGAPASAAAAAAPSLDARRAAFASSATQCGRNYLELASPPLSRSPPPACGAGLLRALAGASRRGRDAPLELAHGCGLKWYSAREACAPDARPSWRHVAPRRP